MQGRTDWLRVDRRNKCSVCGHDSWCTYSAERNIAICPRRREGSMGEVWSWEGDNKISFVGFKHKLDRTKPIVTGDIPNTPAAPIVRNDTLRGYQRDNMRDCELMLKYQAKVLGVTYESLLELCAGIDFAYGKKTTDGEVEWIRSNRRDPAVLTFPMVKPGTGIVGIRKRHLNGKKFSEKGSRGGVIVQRRYTDDPLCLVVEGPSDAAAAITLGFDVIARPQALGCEKWLADSLVGLGKTDVFIWTDNPRFDGDKDHVSIRGATTFCEYLSARSDWKGTVIVATPPTKDLRRWLNTGLDRYELIAAMQARREGKDFEPPFVGPPPLRRDYTEETRSAMDLL
jgi:hypothetical protein